MLSQYPSGEHVPVQTGPERLESSIERVLVTGGTRSELRELVDRFSDRARLVGISREQAIARLDSIAARIALEMPDTAEAAVGDSLPDRLAMMIRWCMARYHRAD